MNTELDADKLMVPLKRRKTGKDELYKEATMESCIRPSGINMTKKNSALLLALY